MLRSLSQIVAYCAAIFSVGSLICGLGRIRRHRKSQRTAYEAVCMTFIGKPVSSLLRHHRSGSISEERLRRLAFLSARERRHGCSASLWIACMEVDYHIIAKSEPGKANTNIKFSIVCFLAAVATVCFNNPDVATAVTLGTVSAVVFVLIVWSVFADSMWARLARGSQHFAERVKQGLMDGWKACGRVRRGERRSSSSSVVCDV